MNRHPLRASRRLLALLALLALFASEALAQGTAVLVGTAVDAATGKPIEDAVVTARSPSLQGERTSVTDATGAYRIAQLPSGAYALRFEHPSYLPFDKSGVTLRQDVTVRFNVQLAPTAVSIELEFTAAPPTVDVGTSTVAVSVDKAFIRDMPLGLPVGRAGASRAFEAAAEIAPGASPDLYGVSVSGTTSPENGYQVDGHAVNDPAFGVNGSSLSLEFVDEVNVITGGYMPEYGRATGGVVSAVTKSGSNELHGSIFGNMVPGLLVSPGTEIQQAAGTISGRTSLWNLGDFGAEVGGPILRDRLWFFAGIAPALTRYAIERQLNAIQLDAAGAPVLDAEGNPATQPIPGTQSRWFADQRSLQYIGKLTYRLGADHNLSLSVSGTPTTSGGNGAFAVDDRSGNPEVARMAGQYGALATQRLTNANDASLKWAGSFLEKRLLVDASLGYHRQDRSVRAADGTRAGQLEGLAARPQVFWARTDPDQHSILELEQVPDAAACVAPDGSDLCPVLNYATGGPGFLSDATMQRYQGKLGGTWLFNALGHHIVKAGLDAELDSLDQTKAYTGRVLYLEGDDGSYFLDFRQFGYLTGPDAYVIQDSARASSTTTIAGGYLQDSWNILDTVLLNAGVRYDAQMLYGAGQKALALGNQISPRVGLIYDPSRKGTAKIFANFARYYEAVPLDLVDRQFPGERQIVSLKDASVCNPLDPASDAACMSDAARLPWRPASDASRYWAATGGVPTIVDPSLAPQSADEIVLGGELQVLPSARAGATYTRRYINSVIEDMSRDDGTTYFIGNPGRGFATDFPLARRDYDAVTVFFTKELGDSWMAQASYTWSTLRGNYEGLFRADTGQLDPNINSDFDLLSLLPNRSGPLPGDRAHQVKVFAAKELRLGQFDLNLGVSYRGTSGAPTNYLGAHLVYGAGEAYLLPRGSGPRLPWVHRIDARLGVTYRISDRYHLTLSADVFNLLDFQAVTSVDENYTFSAALPIERGTPAQLGELRDPNGDLLPDSARNPNFGRPTSYQSPRSVRFGARLSF